MSAPVITGPCWVEDLDEATYHADPCPEPSLSSSMAKTLVANETGPATLHARMAAPPIRKQEFDLGSAVHETVLGRGPGIVEVDADNYRTKTAQQARDEAWAAGLTPVTRGEAAKVRAMSAVLLDHPWAADIVTRGRALPELSMFTIDERTGRWQRGRLDLLIDRHLIVDLKTASITLTSRSWMRQAANLLYHLQAAAYLDQAISLDLVDEDARFCWIAQQTSPPWTVLPCYVSAADLDRGRRLVRHALDLWDRCLATDEWPDGHAQPIESNLPHWADPDTDDTEE
ncbi:PD-(D/E)XK nuclease-like domain-containing protein [Propionibacterium australiense]|nr:PD-(D/E)XK nuclease-like domain-containing protein [Propionibacterium australiense]